MNDNMENREGPHGDPVDACLADMEASAGEMMTALVSRNSDAIIATADRQEALSEKLSGLLKQQAGPTAGGSGVRKAAAERIRRIMRRNASVAGMYLDLIAGVISSLSSDRTSAAYGKHGRNTELTPSPVLVHCRG